MKGAAGEAHYDGQRAGAAQLRRACIVTIIVVLLGSGVVAADDQPPLRVLEDTVFVRAAQARQADDASSLTVSGDVYLRSGAWSVQADRAVISGHLRDPDLIDVTGAPAHIRVQEADDDEPFEGFSQRLQFDPRADVVRLEGAARVEKGGRSVSSESIRYLLDRDTFAAGAGGRVRVVTTPH